MRPVSEVLFSRIKCNVHDNTWDCEPDTTKISRPYFLIYPANRLVDAPILSTPPGKVWLPWHLCQQLGDNEINSIDIFILQATKGHE